MSNLFDGLDGRSDGTADGFSLEFKITGAFNIHIFGTFGGAVVTLQRYSNTTSLFENTDLVWTSTAQFQGLYITPRSVYRLNISGVTTTALIAERA